MALTFSYRLPFAPQPMLTPILGLSVYRALVSSFPSLDWSLKAPNDLLLKGKKIAGCLTEVVSQGTDFRLVFGLGLNVFSSPNGIPSTDLHSNWESLDINEFLAFLDRLLLEITMSVSKRSTKISKSEQGLLVFALNKNPHLAEKLVSVGDEGDLVFTLRTIKWSEL
jgi:BirA family biotin operon repressor/biotin-[acetyl-CoA-carboxylase] ligase